MKQTDEPSLRESNKTTIYMCPPSFFNVEHHLLNVYMTMTIPVDYYFAQNQWWMYYFKLQEVLPDLNIKLIKPRGKYRTRGFSVINTRGYLYM